MTIPCPQCGAVIAEQCPQCGRKAEVKGRLSDAVEAELARAQMRAPRLHSGSNPGTASDLSAVCWCGKCRRYFEQGAGGEEQRRLCEKCSPKQRAFVLCDL